MEMLENSIRPRNKSLLMTIGIMSALACVYLGYKKHLSPISIIKKYNKTPRLKKPRKQRRKLRRIKQKTIKNENSRRVQSPVKETEYNGMVCF